MRKEYHGFHFPGGEDAHYAIIWSCPCCGGYRVRVSPNDDRKLHWCDGTPSTEDELRFWLCDDCGRVTPGHSMVRSHEDIRSGNIRQNCFGTGFDRPSVQAAFREFIADGSMSAEQIEFIGLVVDHLTEFGALEPGLLYESPFTDVAPQGPDQVFDGQRIDRLFKVIEDLNKSAAA